MQEAAFTICNGIAYVETCLARGMKIDDFGHAIELHFCTEMDFFEEVAKYRAMRAVWTQLVRERFGGTTERAQHFRLHAATSGAAADGAAAAQQHRAHHDAGPGPDPRRLRADAHRVVRRGARHPDARRRRAPRSAPNQIIALRDAASRDTVDPLGGSYYLETLTRRVPSAGSSEIIAKVDEHGRRDRGRARAATSSASSPRAPTATRSAVERGRAGRSSASTASRSTSSPSARRSSSTETAVERQVARLDEHARERATTRRSQAALAGCATCCAGDGNVMPAVMDCVEAYATDRRDRRRLARRVRRVPAGDACAADGDHAQSASSSQARPRRPRPRRQGDRAGARATPAWRSSTPASAARPRSSPRSCSRRTPTCSG